ncbi:MAG: YraN family protein [Planctomycetaceae bacterium]|nr:YraN family protein [Planctomycetaceae bacterium]
MKHLLYWSVQVLGPIWRFFRNRGFRALPVRAAGVHDDLGRRGERVARRYLRRQGWRIIAARSQELLGELDLVAVDQGTIVFIEVKTRRSFRAGLPAEAVDVRKQLRLARLALVYLKRHRLLGYPVRFDVLGLTWPRDSRWPQIAHFRDAFTSSLVQQLWG